MYTSTFMESDPEISFSSFYLYSMWRERNPLSYFPSVSRIEYGHERHVGLRFWRFHFDVFSFVLSGFEGFQAEGAAQQWRRSVAKFSATIQLHRNISEVGDFSKYFGKYWKAPVASRRKTPESQDVTRLYSIPSQAVHTEAKLEFHHGFLF